MNGQNWDPDGNYCSSSWNVSHAGEHWPSGEGRGSADYGLSRFVDELDEAHSPLAAGQQQTQERHRRGRHRDAALDRRDREPRVENESMHYRSANRGEDEGSRDVDGQHHRSHRERPHTGQHRDGGYREETESMYQSANRGRQDGTRGDNSRDHRSDREHRRERHSVEHRNRAQAEPPHRAVRPEFQGDCEDTAGYRPERRGRDERYADRKHHDGPRTRPAPVSANPTIGQGYGSDRDRHEYAEARRWVSQGGDVPATMPSTGLTPLEMPRYGSYGFSRREETSSDAIQQQFGDMSLNPRRESADTVGADSTWSTAPSGYDQSTAATSPTSSRSQMPLTRHHRGYDPVPAYDGRRRGPAPAFDGRANDSAQAYDDRGYNAARVDDGYQPPPHVQLGASASTRHRKRSSISEESLLSSPQGWAGSGGFPSGSPPSPMPPPAPVRRQSTWDPMFSRREALPSPGDSNASQPGSSYDARGSPPKKSSRARESQRDEASGKESKKRKKDIGPIMKYVDDQFEAHKYRQPSEEYFRRS